MHEGPTENRLGELGSLYKYYYYYYYKCALNMSWQFHAVDDIIVD